MLSLKENLTCEFLPFSTLNHNLQLCDSSSVHYFRLCFSILFIHVNFSPTHDLWWKWYFSDYHSESSKMTVLPVVSNTCAFFFINLADISLAPISFPVCLPPVYPLPVTCMPLPAPCLPVSHCQEAATASILTGLSSSTLVRSLSKLPYLIISF